MILRRIIEHVKARNWTAVALDIAELCREREVRNAVADMVDIQWDSLAIYRAAQRGPSRYLVPKIRSPASPRPGRI